MQSKKKTTREVVKECEALLKANDMAGAVVAMDAHDGYYELTLDKDSLFEWSKDESSVRMNLKDATGAQVENEFHTLKTISEMLDYCDRAVLSLLELLTNAIDPEPKTEPQVAATDIKHKRRFDN